LDKFELVIGNKNYSSWSLRPWLALKHTGAVFTETRIALYMPGFKKEVARHTGSGKVPVLKHGTLNLWESLAICEYLAELFPAAQLWPESAAERAEARSLSTEMHAGFTGIRGCMPFNCRVRDRRVLRTQDVENEIKRVEEIWNSCRARHQTQGPWLFGRFTIADAMFAPVALRFVTYGVELKGAAQEYMTTVETHAPVQEWIAAAREEREVIESSEVGK
jgi:glutathione S-transferase